MYTYNVQCISTLCLSHDYIHSLHVCHIKFTQFYLHGRWVHEVKGEEVVDAHGLEREHRLRQIGALDLGDCRG